MSFKRKLADKQPLLSNARVEAHMCENSAASRQLQGCAANSLHMYAVVHAVQANAAQKVTG